MQTLDDIAKLLGVSLEGDGRRELRGVSSLAEAGPFDLSFLQSEQYFSQFQHTRAAAVLVNRKLKFPTAPDSTVTVLVEDVELAMSKVLERFVPATPQPNPGIDRAAVVATTATLEQGVAIGPLVRIGERARIGKRCVIHAGVFIGEDVILGDDCQIFPNVVIRERITIGQRAIIHAGAVIGTDGFGYRWDGARHVKLAHIGTVLIEDDVEIGSCTCIDRAKFGATRIGRGTKIDNLVQVAHNCVIGAHCILAGKVGLAGSVRLGEGVVLGGQTAVRDHVTIGDGALAAACSAIVDDIPPKAIVSGTPAIPHRQTLREIAAIHRLPELINQIHKLQHDVDELKKVEALRRET